MDNIEDPKITKDRQYQPTLSSSAVRMFPSGPLCLSWLLTMALISGHISMGVSAFSPIPWRSQNSETAKTTSYLQMAAKKKKKTKKPKTTGSSSSSSGGFGAATTRTTQGTSSPAARPIPADKNALETQWDTFASITDLEIRPKGDPSDEDYVEFEVVDVFVRCSLHNDNDNDNAWFRIGKVCTTSQKTSIEAALTLQRGLILWTAVHMRKELLAKGKAGAQALELAYTAGSLTMGSDTDGAILVPEEDDDDEYESSSASSSWKLFEKAPRAMLEEAVPKSFGFRPDWNPPGFTYKRREKAALKDKRRKKTNLLELAD